MKYGLDTRACPETLTTATSTALGPENDPLSHGKATGNIDGMCVCVCVCVCVCASPLGIHIAVGLHSC